MNRPQPSGLSEELVNKIQAQSRRWLVTGAAGFIGSHLTEALLKLGQSVVGLDDFSTGHRRNLEELRQSLGSDWSRFQLIDGDIRSPDVCRVATQDVDIVLHQAALGSVPRSMDDPLATMSNNVDGTVAIFAAAGRAGIRRMIYASSSSVYGDHPSLPNVEDQVGQPLSPYALSKAVGEQVASLFHRAFGLETLGLRYFNVFGTRQDPDGAYSAVIPRWFKKLMRGQEVEIFGDGKTSRDFCHVANVVQANLLAATTDNPAAFDQVFNVAGSSQTTLNELFGLLRELVGRFEVKALKAEPVYREFRSGDRRLSLASTAKAERLLGYRVAFDVRAGLEQSAEWYRKFSGV